MRNIFKNIYIAWVFISIMLLSVYFIKNGLVETNIKTFAIFIIFSSFILFFRNRIKTSSLIYTIPISILLTAFLFKHSIYPEIVIIGINRFLLIFFSFLPFLMNNVLTRRIKNVFMYAFYTLLIIEIFLIMVFMISPIDILKRRDELFRLSPGMKINNTTVNKHGYLGSEWNEKKGKRIVFIGDSFGVGVVPYSKNFIKMIEDSLKVQTINLSQPGFSPYDYYNQIKKYDEKLNADVYFIMIFLGNDVTEWHIPENNWSINNYRIVNLAKNMFFLINNRKSMDEKGDIQSEIFLKIENRRARENMKDEYYSRYEKYINKIADKLKGREFYFIIIPDEFMINGELQKELHIRYRYDYDWHHAYIKTMEILERGNLKYIDMMKPFIEMYKNNMNPYRENNTHINEFGNYIVFDNVRNLLNNEE